MEIGQENKKRTGMGRKKTSRSQKIRRKRS